MSYFTTRRIIRNLYGQTLLENFLIAAVSAILLIRIYLELTGYPQIGGAHLHIAHMLYGGLMMLAALFILFAFLNRTAVYFASILGGIGFGFFIDELGKFLTRDNDYFFQPTFALIYVIFVLIYLASEAVPKIRTISQKEYLVNAVDLMKEVIIQDLDVDEKKQVLSYLKEGDQKDPIVIALTQVIRSYRSVPDTMNIFTRSKLLVRNVLRRLTQSHKFYRVVVTVLILKSIFGTLTAFMIVAVMNRYLFYALTLFMIALLIYLLVRQRTLMQVIIAVIVVFCIVGINFIPEEGAHIDFDFISLAGFASASFGAFIAFLGLLRFSTSRIGALRFFRLSLLSSIFLTQFFSFYSEQLLAMIGLLTDIVMLITIEFAITQEENKKIDIKRR